MQALKTTLLLVLLVLPVILTAQHRLESTTNLPRPGDILIKQQVRYKDPGRSGENVIWDFSQLSSINDQYKLEYLLPYTVGDSVYILGLDTFPVFSVADNELLIGVEHHTRYYYRLSDNRLWTLGHENPATLLQYTHPLLTAVYPLAYSEKHRENYAYRGTYSSDYAFAGEGTVEIKADAQGMMILPSGDTLQQVLRIKSVQILRQGDSLQTKTLLENYKWYAHGYRYPVFETLKTTVIADSTVSGRFETSFFYPPQDHYYLEDDDENLVIPEDNNTIEKPVDPWEGLKYNIYPKPVTTTVYIELYLPHSAQVKVQIRNQAGLLLVSENKGSLSTGLHSLRLDLPVLITGNYVLTILLDDYAISEILMKR